MTWEQLIDKERELKEKTLSLLTRISTLTSEVSIVVSEEETRTGPGCLETLTCPTCSLPASDVSQQPRVLRRLGAQALGLGHVEQDVHDVGRDVQGQGQPAPPLSFAAVAEHLAPELRPPHEAVVCGT